MALFDPARHYPLIEIDWDCSKVQQAIIAIATETITQLQAQPSLSGHPMDEHEFGTDLYFGKAGVLWTIHYLQTVGAIDSTFDVATHLEATLEQNRQDYSQHSPYPQQSSYLFGELPLLLLQYKLSPADDKANQIAESIHKNNSQLSQKTYGQLRYPLWTGDLGLAVYLWDCLQAQAQFPTVDVF